MMQTETSPGGASNSELALLLLRLWAAKWWIIVIALICVAIAGFIAFTSPPVYRATTILVSADADRRGITGSLSAALGSFGGLASLAGGSLGGVDATIEEALAVLKSREFTEKFIERNNLLPALYPDKWDAKAGKWRGDADDAPNPTLAYKYFDRDIRRVDRDKKTGLVVLQIDWISPAQSALWANLLVDQLNAEMRTRAIGQAAASLEYLERELGATTILETRQAISGLIEGQIKQRMIANVTHQYVFRVIDRAMTPDRSDKVRPKRLLLLAIGGIIGVALGITIVLLRDFFRTSFRGARTAGGVA
jgi:uncharacterized protein involved in exopolysaccharide biosynthesis